MFVFDATRLCGGNCRYGKGWTLGNFPWFTFQTVGGAVVTGSHGSSLSYGSLSSDDMLLALDVVVANGEQRWHAVAAACSQNKRPQARWCR